MNITNDCVRISGIQAFADNYIWAIVVAKKVWLVDPGDASPAYRFLASERLTLAGILLTHHHSDHIGGVAELLARCGSVPVFGPHDDRIPMVTHAVSDADSIRLDEDYALCAKVIACPGHTSSHISYLMGRTLFCGDTLFSAGCGRILGGTPEDYFASLQRIAALDPETLLCCAHEYTQANLRFASHVEPDNQAIIEQLNTVSNLRHAKLPTVPTTLGTELKINPFLRTNMPAVRRRVETEVGTSLPTEAEVWRALREWKDRF
jgi:hydroxyacylglutathione hydrolase